MAGQRHEATQVAARLAGGAVARPGGGRPRRRPDRIAGDKAYTGRAIRAARRRRGIGAVIPRQRTEARRRGALRPRRRPPAQRGGAHHRPPQAPRAIATRYEKLEASFHALLTFAAILLWLPV